MFENTNAFPSKLRTYKKRLDNLEDSLFVEDEKEVEVPYREFRGLGEGK